MTQPQATARDILARKTSEELLDYWGRRAQYPSGTVQAIQALLEERGVAISAESERVTTTRPILLRIGLFITGLMYFGGVLYELTKGRAAPTIHSGTWTVVFTEYILGLTFVLGTWYMKRWAAVSLCALGALAVLMSAGAVLMSINPSSHLWSQAVIRFVPLLPIGVYWSRFK